jgi:HSP20 family protein
LGGGKRLVPAFYGGRRAGERARIGFGLHSLLSGPHCSTSMNWDQNPRKIPKLPSSEASQPDATRRDIMRMSLPSLWGRGYEDPFALMRREFDRLLADFGSRMPTAWPGWNGGVTLPLVDMADTKEAIELSVELPGVAEGDVSVTVEGGNVVIAGEKKAEKEMKEKDWQMMERSYGAFRRIVPLPFSPDPKKIEAGFDKGVLKVKIGKPAELLAKTVEIPIKKVA